MDELFASVDEIGRLLQPPLSPEAIDKAESLALAIARAAPPGGASHLAMQLMSSISNLRRPDAQPAADGGPSHALWRLRSALEESARAPSTAN